MIGLSDTSPCPQDGVAQIICADGPGHGGKGGEGGRGGKGGGSNGVSGDPGEPGHPGEPGEPGERGRLNIPVTGFPIASLITLLVTILGGIYWLIGLETKIAFVARDLASFRENVLSLNTPLSQRVFSAEARINEIARIQSEVRAAIANMDQSGTSQNRVLKRDIDLMRAEILGQTDRCSDLTALVAKLQGDLIETKVRLQFVVEAITPHSDIKKR